MSLPNWKCASEVYSRAYRILDNMAKSGHATPARGLLYKRGKLCYMMQGHVSGTMQDIIDALNKGNEETIKGLLLRPDIFKYAYEVSNEY